MRTMAVAGRRIDAEDAETRRFPLAHVPEVRSRIRAALLEYGPAWLVSSAAAGSDLLAQKVARELGIQLRIVVPFGVDAFRESSVADRPGDWGPQFDRLVHELQPQGNVIDLDLDPAAVDVYERANIAIIDQALSLSGGDAAQVQAMVIWEGRPRGADDTTAAFAEAARSRGIDVRSVLTT